MLAESRKWNIESLKEHFGRRSHLVLEHLSDLRIDYVLDTLTPDERRVVKNYKDYLPAALVKNMSKTEMEWFRENYKILQPMHLLRTQRLWVMDRRYFRGVEQQDTGDVAIADDLINGYSLRFRTMYIFRFMSDPTRIAPLSRIKPKG
jgi:hypothetical protein